MCITAKEAYNLASEFKREEKSRIVYDYILGACSKGHTGLYYSCNENIIPKLVSELIEKGYRVSTGINGIFINWDNYVD